MPTLITSSELRAALNWRHEQLTRYSARSEWPAAEARSGKGGEKRWLIANLPATLTIKGKVVPVRAALDAARSQAALHKHLPAPVLVAPAPLLPVVAPVLRGGEIGGAISVVSEIIGDTRLGIAARKQAALDRYHIIAPVLDGRISGRVAMARHAQSHNISVAALYRWVASYKHGGVSAIENKPRADAGQARVCISSAWEAAARSAGLLPAARAAILAELVGVVRGLWAQQGVNSYKQIQMLAKPVLYKLSVAAGIPETVARKASLAPRKFVEGERRYAIIALQQRDAKGFYDQICTSINRSRAQLQPGDVVFGDVSPADIPVQRPDGKMGWARMIAWRDAATNMFFITGYLAEKGSGVRREHVALSFASMCQDAPWGLPKRLYLDNGSEYNWTDMLESWSALAKFSGGLFGGTWGSDALDDAGKIWRTEPYRPRAKLIEGGFSNLMAFMGWHPCFAGSDRLTKKTRSLGRPIEPTSLDSLRGYIGDAVQFYHGVPQQGHLNGLSPAEKMAEFQNNGYRRVSVDSEVLALSFADSSERRVSAGSITAGNWRYHHPELYKYDGEKLQVRWARHAPDAAYIFEPKSGRFLCAALPMPIFQFSDPEGAKHARRLAAEARQSVDVMRGQVTWLDPRDLMGEFAQLAGVQQVIDNGARGERRVELSDEAKTLSRARDQAAQEAVERAAHTQTGSPLRGQFACDDDPEELSARAMGL